MISTSRFRYPGLQSFDHNDHPIFFGREEEVSYLSMLLSIEPIVVLTGKAGTGKSSLVKAALWHLPELQTWSKYFVRFSNYTDQEQSTLLERLSDQIKPDENNNESLWLDQFVERAHLTSETIWLILKRHELQSPSKRFEFLFVFDQFEEVFTWPKDQIQKFKEELAEVLTGKTPLAFRQAILKDLSSLKESEANSLMSPLRVRILFIIKSDRMNLLNNFSDLQPSVLKYCVEIKPLTRTQAANALMYPTQLQGNFISPTFHFSEEAMDFILSNLENSDGEIDPFQLQIIAHEIELNLVPKLSSSTVQKQDVANIKDALSNFYENALNQLKKKERNLARTLIEEGLISEDSNRVIQISTLQESYIIERYRVPKELLDQLTALHLLRAEYSTQGTSYKLTHDALVAPILKYKEQMQDEEQLILMTNREFQIKEKMRRRRNIILLVTIILLTLLFITFIVVYKR